MLSLHWHLFLITANWCIFIWAVTNRHVVDTSVGYYMNPLVSVLLGVVCFHERLSKMKWFSIAVAAAGIGVMTWELGRFPLIAVGLASTFALYGAVKKKLNLDAFTALRWKHFCSSFCSCLCTFSREWRYWTFHCR